MNPLEVMVENVAAALSLKKGEPHKNQHVRDEFKRMPNELGGDLIGRIGDNATYALGSAGLCQKIHAGNDAGLGPTIVHQLGRYHAMPRITQNAHDGTSAGCWLPDIVGNRFDHQQSPDGLWRRFV